MKRSFTAWAALCVTALIAAILAVGAGINAGETPKSIRIIYSNDMVGYAEPCG